MEKKDIKKAKLWLVSVVVLVLVVNIAFAMVMKPLVQKSSDIKDYMRPGLDQTMDSGEGVKTLVLVTTPAETHPSPISTEGLNYEVQIEPVGNPTDEIVVKPSNSNPLDWVTKPLSNKAFDWVVKPLNQIFVFLFEPAPEVPAVEPALGDLVISDDIANPFE